MSPYVGERKQIIALRVGEVAAMVALDEFWPKSVGVIRSVTIEIVTAIFAFACLSSLLVALRVSVVCTSLTASDLWQIIVSVAAVPAVLNSAVIAFRMRRSLEQIKMTHEELVNLARIDGLTELLDRPGFDAVATEAFAETRRSGEPISALLCDIDAFRGLNDRYGHEAGDRALRNFAEVLEESIGCRSAILGRQGADEFVILLPGIDLKGAVTIAEGLCEACEARALVQQDLAAKFTISVGVGTEASGASELKGLLRQTDAALYRAKRAGGNQVVSGPGRFAQRPSAPNIERFPTRSAKLFVPLQEGL
jgi:diguanylate cyclase (GGDEF)-like protein